jgi:hypothetical protein
MWLRLHSDSCYKRWTSPILKRAMLLRLHRVSRCKRLGLTHTQVRDVFALGSST